jgi:hypothetical protein
LEAAGVTAGNAGDPGNRKVQQQSRNKPEDEHLQQLVKEAWGGGLATEQSS